MDSSKQPPDTNDEAHSLEGSSTLVEADNNAPNTSAGPGKDTTIDASGGAASTPPSAKPPLFKRMWQKFNIYLLLLLLITLIAIAVTIGLFLKDQNENKNRKDIINSQDLSDEALKQLANSSISVGNSKQILTVESNAIFSGSVLVRSNLEVAGSIKVGNELQLPGITVSGSSRFNELQTNNLAVGNNVTVQGTFVARRGIAVSGNSTFDGPLSATSISTNSLQLNGDLILTHHITAGGPVPNVVKGTAVGGSGTVSLSGSDTTGSLVINTGSGPGAGCFATITFARKFNGVPHVVITPIGSAAAGINYYVNRGTTEFSICTTTAAPAGQTFGFDYMVLN